MARPVIFISYSHLNEAEKDQLVAHLNVLRHDGIDLWIDDDIGGGEDWEQRILEHIAGASVAVLLVSAHFLGSDFIVERELPALLERRDSGSLALFPIIAHHCAWREVPWLRSMNVRPKNGAPVWDDDIDSKEVLASLVEEIADVVRARRAAHAPATAEADTPAPITVRADAFTIRYDPAIYRRDFLGVLERLSDSLQTESMEQVFGRDSLRHWRRQQEEILRRLETDFSLVVIGPFKRGKSTLINALLGQVVVSSDIAPETVTINEIRYGPELRIEACLADGGRLPLKPDWLAHDKLVAVLEKLPRELSHLDVRAPVDWLRGLCLVDTPGTGDLLMRFDRTVQEYLARADAVLFVLSPLAPLSESERSFLQLAVLPRDFAKINFVVNMLDKVRSESDVRRVMDLLRYKVERMFPDASLHGLSAGDELARVSGQERPVPERSASLAALFELFRAHLEESVLRNRELIQLDRGVADVERLLKSVETHGDRLRRALETDQSRLRKAIDACEDETSDLRSKIEQGHERLAERVEALGAEAAGWLAAFVDRLEAAARELESFSSEDLQRHFPFFLADSLSNAIHRCLEAHRPHIVEALKETEESLSQDLDVLTDVADAPAALRHSASAASFGDVVWDRLETSELLVEFTQQHVFGMAADLMRKLGQASRERQQVLLYQQQTLNSLPGLRISLLREAREIYAGMARRLVDELRARQQENLETSLHSLRQARELDGAGAGELDATLQRARMLVDGTRTALAEFQGRLWPDLTEGTDDGSYGSAG